MWGKNDILQSQPKHDTKLDAKNLQRSVVFTLLLGEFKPSDIIVLESSELDHKNKFHHLTVRDPLAMLNIVVGISQCKL